MRVRTVSTCIPTYLCLWILDQQLAQEQVLELLPLVGEANAISEELDKHKYDTLNFVLNSWDILLLLCSYYFRNFELVLISGAAQGNLSGNTKYVDGANWLCKYFLYDVITKRSLLYAVIWNKHIEHLFLVGWWWKWLIFSMEIHGCGIVESLWTADISCRYAPLYIDNLKH